MASAASCLGGTASSSRIYSYLDAFGQTGGELCNPGSPWGIQAGGVPGGAKLLLITDTGGTRPSQLYVVNADGSGAPALGNPVVLNNGASSSPTNPNIALDPTGTRLVYAEADGLLHVAGLGGANDFAIPGTANAVVPAWSPDGKWIAFVSSPTGLTVVHPDPAGSGLKVLDPNGSVAHWFPDSKRLVYVKDGVSGGGDGPAGHACAPRTDGSDLAVVDISGGGPHTLGVSWCHFIRTDGSNDSYEGVAIGEAAVSPDGTQIVVWGLHDACMPPGTYLSGCSGEFPSDEVRRDELAIIPSSGGKFPKSGLIAYTAERCVVSDTCPADKSSLGGNWDGASGSFGDLWWGGPPKLPVVLVTGLHDDHAGMTPDGDCSTVGSVAAICAALQNAGFPVYVPSSGPTYGTVINNRQGYDTGAQSLKAYLGTEVGRPALLVGHSMGGIFSRIAIADGVKAAGLFTIGSPFDGSFAADLAVGAATFPCQGGPCTLIRDTGKFALDMFGPVAMQDLTSTARNAENLRLTPPGVKTWMFAGTACHPRGVLGVGGYLFPNDGVVGKSSAYGVSANLGPRMLSSGDDYHQGLLQALSQFPFCSGGLELTDQSIISQVLAAANELDAEQAGLPAADTGDPARATVAAAHPGHVVVYLQTATVASIKPGSKLPLGVGASVLSMRPFAIKCNGHEMPALAALGGRAFGFPTGVLSCARATLSGHRSVRLGIATDPERASATITPKGTEFTITVTATKTITRLTLRNGKRTVHLIQHRLSNRSIRLTVTTAQAVGLSLTATIAHHQYTATISTLR